MIIALKDVPGYERHLLYCTNLFDHRRPKRRRRRATSLKAVNRSLHVHGEHICKLACRPTVVSTSRRAAGVA